MNFSEKNIEDLIVNSISYGKINELSKRGLWGIDGYHKFFRQLDLGPYGRLDLAGMRYLKNKQELGRYKEVDICLIEIKKGEINYNSFIQAIRYCKGIQKLVENYKMTANFEIKLIGTTVCTSDFCYLTDFMENLDIYTVQLDLEQGITFKNEFGYELTNHPKITLNDFHLSEIKQYLVNQTKLKTEEIDYNPF